MPQSGKVIRASARLRELYELTVTIRIFDMSFFGPVEDSKVAERLALEFAGPGRYVEASDHFPEGGYFAEQSTDIGILYFVFSIHDDFQLRVGGTQYIGVSRTTGEVRDLGVFGE